MYRPLLLAALLAALIAPAPLFAQAGSVTLTGKCTTRRPGRR